MGWGGSAESEQYQLFNCQLVLPLCLLLDCVGLMYVRFNINMATIVAALSDHLTVCHIFVWKISLKVLKVI